MRLQNELNDLPKGMYIVVCKCISRVVYKRVYYRTDFVKHDKLKIFVIEFYI